MFPSSDPQTCPTTRTIFRVGKKIPRYTYPHVLIFDIAAVGPLVHLDSESIDLVFSYHITYVKFGSVSATLTVSYLFAVDPDMIGTIHALKPQTVQYIVLPTIRDREIFLVQACWILGRNKRRVGRKRVIEIAELQYSSQSGFLTQVQRALKHAKRVDAPKTCLRAQDEIKERRYGRRKYLRVVWVTIALELPMTWNGSDNDWVELKQAVRLSQCKHARPTPLAHNDRAQTTSLTGNIRQQT